jgi:hypothetical protein
LIASSDVVSCNPAFAEPEDFSEYVLDDADSGPLGAPPGCAIENLIPHVLFERDCMAVVLLAIPRVYGEILYRMARGTWRGGISMLAVEQKDGW